jgi:predicted acylesterase/phospholipase RssA
MRRAIAAISLFLSSLAGCAHPRPALWSSVAIPATTIAPGGAAHGSAIRTAEASTFARQIASGTDARRPAEECALPQLAGAPPRNPGPVRYLVLSGGSLHGAFGAGFFLGLQESNLLPDEPDVVTGVSTGSLQAAFLFLARERVPADRDYRWQGGFAMEPGDGLPPIRAGQSNVEDLAAAYTIRKEADILKPVPLGGIGLLLNGTMGQLTPLRDRLFALISPETIHEIAIEACRGRQLFVGVTDVDDGQAYALDLTSLALRAYDGNATPQLMTLVRKAFVESLIASSSVPAGAKPVSLRIRDFDRNDHRINLFVDGGARFGVFLQEIRNARMIEALASRGGAPGDVTLVVNTELSMDPWRDEDLHDPKTGWLLTTLGLRTIDILENQVYRLSVGDVETMAGDLGGLRVSYLANDGTGSDDTPDGHVYRGQACSAWHALDEARGHPIQFYPTYMACLIDYGRQRGRQNLWNKRILAQGAAPHAP